MNLDLNNLLNNVDDLAMATPSSAEAKILAFMQEGHRRRLIMLAYIGEQIAADIENISNDIEDFFNDNYPPNPGLWIWEGICVYTQTDIDEWESNYTGQWRRLTNEELKTVAIGGDVLSKTETSSLKMLSTEGWFNELTQKGKK